MQYEIRKTPLFHRWLKKLRDRQAVLAINKRITRMALGNFGDSKGLGSEVSELRFFIGPGYRVYYTIRRETVVLLLLGGTKDSQAKDIKKARELAAQLEE